eukprot:365626-Chlamydomonas_euryale.AAC.1
MQAAAAFKNAAYNTHLCQHTTSQPQPRHVQMAPPSPHLHMTRAAAPCLAADVPVPTPTCCQSCCPMLGG